MGDIFERLGFTPAETEALVSRVRRVYSPCPGDRVPTKATLGPPLDRARNAARALVEAMQDLPPVLQDAFRGATVDGGERTLADAIGDQDPFDLLHRLAGNLAELGVEIRVSDGPGTAPVRQRDFAANRVCLIVFHAYRDKTGLGPAFRLNPARARPPRYSGEFVELLEAVARAAGVPVQGLADRAVRLPH